MSEYIPLRPNACCWKFVVLASIFVDVKLGAQDSFPDIHGRRCVYVVRTRRNFCYIDSILLQILDDYVGACRIRTNFPDLFKCQPLLKII